MVRLGGEVEVRRPSHRALRVILCLTVLALVAAGCSRDRDDAAGPGSGATTTQPDTVVSMSLIHMNDVYELTPVSGGKEGGLARLATLRRQVLAGNPNTYTVLAGDLLSPSALGTATVEGERLAGRQMVDVMNILGLDYATFGNHEFDLTQEQLTRRLSESRVRWFSSNVTDPAGQPLPNVPTNIVFTARNGQGNEVRVGLFGLTLNSNPASFVSYRDPMVVAKEQVAALRDRVDILIAVTHLFMDGDMQLVQNVPEIDLVLGGHEHENAQVWRGADFTPVFKADANARTVYVHDLSYDTATKKLRIESNLERITGDLPDDPQVQAAVDRWVEAGFAGFRSQGFDPKRVVATITEELDGREASVRNFPTRLTDLLAAGMVRAAPGTELAVFNAGSIRIDDVIPPGEVTEYDVIRTLPFGGVLLSAEITGSLLQRVLDQGRANAGRGGFLQTANVSRPEGDRWVIGGSPLDPARTYKVAINDFLLTGREAGLDFLTRDNPEVTNLAEHGDIRKALIAELQR
jgi:5'-nucleotidase/UDP-sugar diphosphatase